MVVVESATVTHLIHQVNITAEEIYIVSFGIFNYYAGLKLIILSLGSGLGHIIVSTFECGRKFTTYISIDVSQIRLRYQLV